MLIKVVFTHFINSWCNPCSILLEYCTKYNKLRQSLLENLFVKIASPPSCFSSQIQKDKISVKEFDNIELTCSINFEGNWSPYLKWQLETKSGNSSGVIKNSKTYKSVTYHMTAKVTRNMTGSKLLCNIYFSPSNKPSNAHASNLPEYNATWLSPDVDVQCEFLYYLLFSSLHVNIIINLLC